MTNDAADAAGAAASRLALLVLAACAVACGARSTVARGTLAAPSRVEHGGPGATHAPARSHARASPVLSTGPVARTTPPASTAQATTHAPSAPPVAVTPSPPDAPETLATSVQVVRARLLYEHLATYVRSYARNVERPRAVSPAGGVAFAILDEHDAVLARGETAPRTGALEVRVSARPGARLRVRYSALHGPLDAPSFVVAHEAASADIFAPPRDLPPRARAHDADDADDDDERDADLPVNVWTWSFPVVPDGPVTSCLVRANEGAAALYVLALARTHEALLRQTLERAGADPPRLPSLLIQWGPHALPACSSCYTGRHFGPFLALEGAQRFGLESRIELETAALSTAAVVPDIAGHELGHWVMDGLGALRPTGGPRHALRQRLAPDDALVEAWAHYWSQHVLSERTGVAQPLVLDVCLPGLVLDLERASVRGPFRRDAFTRLAQDGVLASSARAPEHTLRVTARDALERPMSEAFVASVLWHLRTVFGPDALPAALASARDRGSPGLDLRDLLDALVCAAPDRAARVEAVLRATFGLWYQPRGECRDATPGGGCAGRAAVDGT